MSGSSRSGSRAPTPKVSAFESLRACSAARSASAALRIRRQRRQVSPRHRHRPRPHRRPWRSPRSCPPGSSQLGARDATGRKNPATTRSRARESLLRQYRHSDREPEKNLMSSPEPAFAGTSGEGPIPSGPDSGAAIGISSMRDHLDVDRPLWLIDAIHDPEIATVGCSTSRSKRSGRPTFCGF